MGFRGKCLTDFISVRHFPVPPSFRQIYHELFAGSWLKKPVCVSSSSRPRLSSNQRLPRALLRVKGASISSNRKETVHQLYSTRVAILAGDFMFAQSSWYLVNLENLEVIKLNSQDFASGEIKQASSLFDCDVKLEDYLLKSYYKTASLIAASTKGATIFSEADRSVTEEMYEHGKNLGLSFQVVDDILDFTQSAEQLGKPAGRDLAKGNLTAPVIFALEKEPKLRDIIESEFCETGSLDEAIELVKQCEGIERAQELVKEKADIATKSLQRLPQSDFQLGLEDMVIFNLERID